MNAHDTQELTINQKTAVCPSCGQHNVFTCVGEQHWSAAVAKATGLPQVIRLWMCQNCETTLLEPGLQFED